MPAVNDNVWAAQDTTPAAIEAALRELLLERHHESDGYVPARGLNLICTVERQGSGETPTRRRRVGRYPPSRTIVCAVSEGRRTIDAVASIAADATPTAGQHVLTHETVILDLGPAHLARGPRCRRRVAASRGAAHPALRCRSRLAAFDAVARADRDGLRPADPA